MIPTNITDSDSLVTDLKAHKLSYLSVVFFFLFPSRGPLPAISHGKFDSFNHNLFKGFAVNMSDHDNFSVTTASSNPE